MGVVGHRVRVVVAAASLLAGVSVSVAPPALAGETINVPGSQPTIQDAIDNASKGDIVVVAPGTYFEHIDFKGKAIEVRSSAGAQSTVIDGGGTDIVVKFKSGEGRSSVLRGFTITHGAVPPAGDPAVQSGAGIGMTFASPTITQNIVTDNDSGPFHGGGGIGTVNGSPLILDNHIVGNRAGTFQSPGPDQGGGGIAAWAGAPEIVMNVVEGNTADAGGGMRIGGDASIVRGNVVRGNTAFGGAGLHVSGGRFVNNLVVDNTAEGGGGGLSWEHTFGVGAAYLLNNTIAGNEGSNPTAVAGASGAATFVNNVITGRQSGNVSLLSCGTGAVATFSHNNIFKASVWPYNACADPTGSNGNISADPKFTSPATGDYRPQPGSPVIDAGDNNAPSLPATDIRDGLRITDGTGDGVAVVDMGAVESQSVAPPSGHRYHPLPPARLLDTRIGLGAPLAKIGTRLAIDLQVTGRGGIPADGVDAVVLNVAVTQPTAQGWLTAWPAGAPFPLAANLNFVAGQTVANLVTVKVGAGGKVSFFNSAGSTDVVADVAGWYGGVDGGSGYFPLPPARILDTRSGPGAPVAKVGPGATLPLQITGQGGVPASGVSAVVFNVAVTNTTADGYLTAWPAGQTQPFTSSLNFAAGQTVPNLVVVKVGSGGQVNLFNSSGSTDVVADVAGWFGADGAPGGANFRSVVPSRIIDTREGLEGGRRVSPATPLAPGATISVPVTGIGGIPPGSEASAAVLNVTVTGAASGGWLTVWPAGADRPLASNLNYVAGQTVPNLVVVPISAGHINIYSSGGPVDVVADVAGWY